MAATKRRKKRQSVLEASRFRCYLCGDRVQVGCKKTGVRKMTMDHVVPVSRGGSDDQGNLRPACGECNQNKGAWTHAEVVLGFRLDGKQSH